MKNRRKINAKAQCIVRVTGARRKSPPGLSYLERVCSRHHDIQNGEKRRHYD